MVNLMRRSTTDLINGGILTFSGKNVTAAIEQ
jgi:hypothetical protein